MLSGSSVTVPSFGSTVSTGAAVASVGVVVSAGFDVSFGFAVALDVLFGFAVALDVAFAEPDGAASVAAAVAVVLSDGAASVAAAVLSALPELGFGVAFEPADEEGAFVAAAGVAVGAIVEISEEIGNDVVTGTVLPSLCGFGVGVAGTAVGSTAAVSGA